MWCVGTAPGSDDVVPCHDVADVFATAFASPTVPSEAYDGAVVNVEALLTPVYGATIASAAAAPGGILKDGTLAPSVAAMLPLTAANPVIYFSTVTAVNEVGLRRTAYSDGVQLDLQPPVVGMVMDSPDVDVPDVDVQASLTTITASWNHLHPSLHSSLKRENPDPRSKTAPPARFSGNYCRGRCPRALAPPPPLLSPSPSPSTPRRRPTRRDLVERSYTAVRTQRRSSMRRMLRRKGVPPGVDTSEGR